MTWREHAACRDQTATMYPDYPDYGPALAIYAICPVIGPCREASVHEPWGVWGGTVPEERGFLNGQRCHSAKMTRHLAVIAAMRASSASAAS